MPVEVIFPRVDMDMTVGRVGRWLVGEGGQVRRGEPLFEIETDKAAMEIEAPASGTLRGVAAGAGDEVEVGTVVGWIVGDGEAWVCQGSAPDPQIVDKIWDPNARRLAGPGAELRISLTRATPLARREARRLGIELQALNGSGPNGRVQGSDVRAAAPPVTALHREWAGLATGTPVVFLHGFGAEIASWRAVWPRLERSQRLLGIDLPGHGRSAAGEASFASLLEAVRGTLAAEGLSSIHLVGHSLGGALALALADAGGIEVRSLVLLAPAGLGPEVDASFIDGFLRAEHEASLAAWLRRLFADPGHVTPSLVASILRTRTDEARAFQRALAAALFVDGTQAIWLRDALAQLSMPTKLIWGRADRVIPSAHAHGLPGRVALHFCDAGHEPQVEAASLVATLIEEAVRAG